MFLKIRGFGSLISLKTKFLCVACCLFVSLVACKKEPVRNQDISAFFQVSPHKDTTNIDANAVFIWEPGNGATSYSLVIAKDSAFKNVVFSIADINTPTYKLNTPLVAGTLYYWKVIAINAGTQVSAANSGMAFRVKASSVLPSPGVSMYYVSPNGEDNPDKGTQANPFKTLAYAATMVPPSEGDTIVLTAGRFEETQPAIIPIGVSIVGAGETATILSSKGVKIPSNVNPTDKDFKLWYDGALIQLVSAHNSLFRNTKSLVIAPENGNQTLSGFTIDGNGKQLKAGVWVENRNKVSMQHVSFLNIGQRGAVFGSGNKDWYVYPEFYMKDITIHDCTFTNCGKDLTDETLGNLNIAQLDGAEIYNLNIVDNEGYGIKFIYDGYFKNVKIHDCTITVNESDKKWGEDISIELWNVGPGNEIYNINCNTWLSIVNHPEMFAALGASKNMLVHNVRMIDKDGISGKESIEMAAPHAEIYDSYFENKGIGIAVWDMGRENITIRNNIFLNSAIKDNWAGGPAIYIDNSRTWDYKNIQVYNNVFDTHRIGVRVKGEHILDVAIKNNVFLGTTVSDVESTAQTTSFTNNLKNKGASSSWVLVGVTSQSDNYLSNPGFQLTGEKWDTYYKPSSSQSAVVDKGTMVGIDFKGTAPDIGRWEY